MRKFLLIVFILLGAALGRAVAQDRTISGRVVDRTTNEGLPGVTVLVKGTQIGGATNADGSFSLSVPASATTLSISSVGYTSVDQAITDGSMSISLVTDTKQLNEVVVTALGVERTRNSLPYAATTVEGGDITKARNPNFINGLSGKVAGLSVRQSNTLGGSSNVVIRGTKSLTSTNQALFVVDGVVISNSNTNGTAQATGGGGYDYGNAAADVNPDDIASTTVLKGAAATALYGSRAANGVIIITTKKGRKGLGVTVNAGVTAGQIDKSTFIKHQKKYGAGYGRFYEDESGYFLLRDFDGDGEEDDLGTPTSEDASYGARFDPSLQVFQYDAFDPSSPNFGKARPWVAASNDASEFFQRAITTNNSIVIDGGNDLGFFKLGYTNIGDRGILENSKVNKNIVNLAASYNVTPKLTTSGTVNFTKINGLGRYGTGYSSQNQMGNFRQWWQTNVDVKQQREEYFRNRQNKTWNYTDPTDLNPIYWNNPYWTRYENFETDERYRYFGNVAATYKFADWFDVLGRVTLDSYDEVQEERGAIGSTTNDSPPFYTRFNRTFREYNFDLIGNFNKRINEDFGFRGLVGLNLRRSNISSIFASTNGGLVVPRLYSLSNTKDPLVPPTETFQRQGVDGVFASTTFDFKNMVFLDLTLRRDESTTLPADANDYYYPSVAAGFVFSELMPESKWLSYGKVRANYAEVGNDAPVFSLGDVYDKPTAFGSQPLFSVPGTKNNPNLLPERTRSSEVGLEMSFLQNRFGFEVTGYNTSTINQIFPVAVSTATGYNSRFINSGEVQNRGIEVTAFATPVKTDLITWTINANWTRNRNKVVSLYETEGNVIDNIVLATYQGGLSSNATVGQPYGTLRGQDYVYHENGQKIVSPTTGYYLRTASSNVVIGNPNPEWNGGLANTVAVKGVSLYFLIDVRKGGDIFSLDRYYGLATGMTEETAGLNDLGNESRAPIVRNADGTVAPNSGGVILPGVLADGSPNTRRVSNTNFGLYGYARNPNAGFVYDASYVKLREVALSYSLPQGIVSKLGAVKGIDLSIVGRNLWIIHKNLPDADPEDQLSSGNLGQGYQSGAYPSVRTLGANVRLSF